MGYEGHGERGDIMDERGEGKDGEDIRCNAYKRDGRKYKFSVVSLFPGTCSEM
jgi:hypothetical protein